MNIQVVIIAHGNAIAVFKQHEKFWLAHKAPLLVICPDNDPLESAHETLKLFKADHSGVNAAARLKQMLHELDKRSWETCVIYEYDSFILDAKLPAQNGFHGILMENLEVPRSRFIAPTYGNPPWTFDRHSFDLMLAKAIEFPEATEEGYADRYLSALAFLAGVPIMDYHPPGFTRGTITKRDLGQVRAAIYDKATAFHGIKQDWILRAVEQFYDEANPS